MRKLILVSLLWAAPLAAQEITPADIPRGKPDYHQASSGSYRLDPGHTSVEARVPHMGFSISVFRFGAVEGNLDWNPNDPGKSRLTAKVDPASIMTPVAGFAEALTGKDYLDTATYPEASFTTGRFNAESDTTGTVSGDLTIMGKTHPVTFQAKLVGAGKGYTGDAEGRPIIRDLIGLSATTEIDPQAYGLNAFFTDPITIQIEAEFAKTSE